MLPAIFTSKKNVQYTVVQSLHILKVPHSDCEPSNVYQTFHYNQDKYTTFYTRVHGAESII
jgi:hypothetical protein